MVSSRGGKHGFVYRNRHRIYRALRREGKSASVAAAISNAGHTRGGRSRMAKKASRTRKAKGRKR